MKNKSEDLIFHTTICEEASQIVFMAEAKSPARISLRPVARILRNGDSMKNKSEDLIFHTTICGGASQIVFMAEAKSPARISLRPVAQMLQNGE